MKWGSRLYHFCKKWCLPCLGMPSAGLSEGSPTGKGHPCTPSFSCLGLTLGKALPTLRGLSIVFGGYGARMSTCLALAHQSDTHAPPVPSPHQTPKGDLTTALHPLMLVMLFLVSRTYRTSAQKSTEPVGARLLLAPAFPRHLASTLRPCTRPSRCH